MIAVVAIVLALLLWRAITFTVTHDCVRWDGGTCAWYQRSDGREWTHGDTVAKGRWGWFYSLIHTDPESRRDENYDPGDCDPHYGSC